jgi:hypothetical protein
MMSIIKLITLVRSTANVTISTYSSLVSARPFLDRSRKALPVLVNKLGKLARTHDLNLNRHSILGLD